MNTIIANTRRTGTLAAIGIVFLSATAISIGLPAIIGILGMLLAVALAAWDGAAASNTARWRHKDVHAGPVPATIGTLTFRVETIRPCAHGLDLDVRASNTGDDPAIPPRVNAVMFAVHASMQGPHTDALKPVRAHMGRRLPLAPAMQSHGTIRIHAHGHPVQSLAASRYGGTLYVWLQDRDTGKYGAQPIAVTVQPASPY